MEQELRATYGGYAASTAHQIQICEVELARATQSGNQEEIKKWLLKLQYLHWLNNGMI